MEEGQNCPLGSDWAGLGFVLEGMMCTLDGGAAAGRAVQLGVCAIATDGDRSRTVSIHVFQYFSMHSAPMDWCHVLFLRPVGKNYA